MKSYILNHWRGAHSLAVSYWINGALINLCFFAFVFFYAARMEQIPESELEAAGTGLVHFLRAYGVILLWQIVGLWRCCERRINEGRRFWPYLVKGLIIIGLLSMSVQALLGLTTVFIPV